MTRILVVEDHVLVREAMAQTLQRLDEQVECVGVKTADEALEELERNPDRDLAVIDLMLPDMNGFSLLGILAKRFPELPAIVVSALDDSASIQRAMKSGASGFVPKSCSSEELLDAIRIVLDGGIYTPKEEAGSARRRGGAPIQERFGLTTAQTRVMELLAQGKTNREIADLLGLSEGTVKVHMSAIFRALNVTNRAQAVLVITRHGARL
ncbi:response regulator transcription factor [Nitrogeniibacter mangrovi]|uniref:Response regulator transcription factor n=1 Tax=Nitrogeniibacter mangrovi TaxID=2016596 RepID=A0A6C1B8M5_9RHOO|nr:response regulator transcription factor [Nitrogeniibacter mangrovi]QID19078.1 response regulator transcription factor [Nitrogeniibacter mangrovi]